MIIEIWKIYIKGKLRLTQKRYFRNKENADNMEIEQLEELPLGTKIIREGA